MEATAQKLLLVCKEKISKIIKILGEQNSEEVTEFHTTVQMVQVVVNRLLNGKKEIKIDLPLLDRINVTLSKYLGILEEFVQSGRLKRLLNSNRIRRRLEKINSELHAQLKLFVDSLKKLNTAEGADLPSRIGSPTLLKKHPTKSHDKKEKKDKEKKKKKKTSSKDTKKTKKDSPKKRPELKTKEEEKKPGEATSTMLYTPVPKNEEGEKETASGATKQDQEDDKLDIIKDVEGKAMWAKLFGEENFMVEWDKFISALAQVLKTEISTDDATLLKHVLDNSGCGNVNMYKWSEFLKGFGPIPDIIKNVHETLFAPWFHGFLSSKEAELLLEDQPVGTYLIRFSRSSGGSFALAFVQEPRRILHILIQSAQPEGFRIEEEEDAEAKVFRTLRDVVSHYSMHLITPFTSDLPRESWFHGDVSSQEAGELLADEKDGTFLIRFSSVSGCFAASYKGDGEIKHALIQAVEGGYLFSGEQEVFPNLKALIVAYSTTLQRPLPNVENNVASVLSKYWAAKGLEKKETVLSQDSHYESVRSHVNK